MTRNKYACVGGLSGLSKRIRSKRFFFLSSSLPLPLSLSPLQNRKNAWLAGWLVGFVAGWLAIPLRLFCSIHISHFALLLLFSFTCPTLCLLKSYMERKLLNMLQWCDAVQIKLLCFNGTGMEYGYMGSRYEHGFSYHSVYGILPTSLFGNE